MVLVVQARLTWVMHGVAWVVATCLLTKEFRITGHELVVLLAHGVMVSHTLRDSPPDLQALNYPEW